MKMRMISAHLLIFFPDGSIMGMWHEFHRTTFGSEGKPLVTQIAFFQLWLNTMIRNLALMNSTPLSPS